MTLVQAIKIRGLRQVGRLDADLSTEPSNIVLIGRAGSGKTTLMQELAKEIEAELQGRPHPAVMIETVHGDDTELRMAYLTRPVRLGWTLDPADAFEECRLAMTTLLDDRRLEVARGPFESGPKAPRERVAGSLTALLTARWIRKNNAEGMEAQVHEAWFLGVRQALRWLIGAPELRFALSPAECALDLGDGRRPTFAELSRSQATAVSIFAEIFVRVEALRERAGDPSLDPRGLVVIDGIERDLDTRMQYELLPGLAARFPRMQWIVSTQSPIVAASFDGARVIDLGTGDVQLAESLREEGLEASARRMAGLAPIQATPAARPKSAPPARQKSAPPKSAPPPRAKSARPPAKPTRPKSQRPPAQPGAARVRSKVGTLRPPAPKITAPRTTKSVPPPRPGSIPPPRPGSIPAPRPKSIPPARPKSMPPPGKLPPRSAPPPGKLPGERGRRRPRHTKPGGPWDED